MTQATSTTTFTPDGFPGCLVKLKIVSHGRRAKLIAALAANSQASHDLLVQAAKFDAKLDEIPVGDDGQKRPTPELMAGQVQLISQNAALQNERQRIMVEHFFESISGFTLDGREPGINELLADAPESLVVAIAEEIDRMLQGNGEQEKN